MKTLFKLALAAFFTLFATVSYAFQMWMLVSSQFAGGTWYCKYQLMGSNPPIVQTITNPMGCQGAITQ
jgi:hypothetical protein